MSGKTIAADDAVGGEANNGAGRWQPGDADSQVATHRQCQGCARLVTEQFRRVFGDNDDVAHACPACATRAQLTDGAGATPGDDTDDDVAERRSVAATGEGGGRP